MFADASDYCLFANFKNAVEFIEHNIYLFYWLEPLLLYLLDEWANEKQLSPARISPYTIELYDVYQMPRYCSIKINSNKTDQNKIVYILCLRVDDRV